ncbi:queuosine precursor transporter [Psittacicella gerlachiana]|uniref:Queuosine precursor transporter n=1 Tax=Psittacicella gerlachiana TaxID=2028574 RepID=A0A3A1YSC8_9GAMM|nr:queuosine precursor transporter [Psittacicella gerlachiana]RIY38927.1 hypothetical protein CKF59_00055 [Psittacicella gerlachiana]
MKLVWIFGYVLSVLLANITLDAFIPLPIYGQLSIGTLFFAFIFTIRDRIHGYGLKYVFIAIGLALLVTVTYSLLYGIEARFIFASFLSIAVSEFTDTIVFQNLKKRNWLLRCLTSNVISVPLDSFLFTFLAFWGNPEFPLNFMLEIIYADVLTKYVIAAIIAFPIYFFGKNTLLAHHYRKESN